MHWLMDVAEGSRKQGAHTIVAIFKACNNLVLSTAWVEANNSRM
jgi:hypothetical protein